MCVVYVGLQYTLWPDLQGECVVTSFFCKYGMENSVLRHFCGHTCRK